MKSIEVESITDLMSYVMDTYYKLDASDIDYPSVDLVAEYWVIDIATEMLMSEYGYSIYYADIDRPDDADVYTLSVSQDGLWIAPTYSDGEWEGVTTVTYVQGDVPSEYVIENKNSSNVMIEWNFEDNEDDICDGDCENCPNYLSPEDQAVWNFLRHVYK